MSPIRQVHVTIRLTPAQLAALKAAAGREHRTVSQYVRLKCGVEGKRDA